MSTIDNRVVRMSFDNREFESGVRDTMSSLEKLKSSLNFSKSSSSDLNLSGIATGISMLSGNFSALGVIGIRTLERLTDRALSLGEALVSAVTTDSIKDGFREYELQMDSVKTIMASTGKPIATVNKYLDELNTYADKTIYSFSDMTNNIGKFTNAGVKLEDAVMAIKGIANEAAVSGANSQEASRAMYNFSQAMSGGSVKLRDWMSIENANMATAEFKQQLIDTGVELGTLQKQSDGTYKVLTKNGNGAEMKETITNTKNFRDSLAYTWMTSDVLTTTLKKYADETTEIGHKAFEAAQDVTTFTKLIDTLKEALGSSWNKTFQLVIGDFEEAKKFWTEVSKSVSGVIESFGNARNAMFQIWHDNGGREAMIESLRNTWNGIKEVFTVIGEAFRNVVPPMTGEKLLELTNKIKDITSNFKLSTSQADFLRESFTALFNIVKIGGRILVAFGGMLKPIHDLLRPFAKHIISTISSVSKFINNLANSDDMLEFLKNNIALLPGLFKSEMKKIASADYGDIFGDIFDKFSKSINKAKNEITKFFPQLEGGFDKLGKTVDETKKKITSFFSKSDSKGKSKGGGGSGSKERTDELMKEVSLIDTLISIMKSNTPITYKFDKSIKAIKKSIKEFKQVGILSITENILSLGKSFEKTTTSISQFVNKTKQNIFGFLGIGKKKESGGKSSFSFIETIQKKFASFVSYITKLTPKITQGLKSLYTTVQTYFPKIVKYFVGDNFGDLLDNITKLFTIGWYKNINGLIKARTDGLKQIFGSFNSIIKDFDDGAKKITKSFTSIFDNFDKAMNKKGSVLKDDHISRNLLKIAASIGVLVVSLIQLSKVKPENLALGLGAIVASFVILFKVYSQIQKVSESINDVGDAASISTVLNQFLKIGFVVKAISGAIKSLGTLDTGSLIKGVLAFFGITEMLIHTLKRLSAINDNSSSGIIGMQAISKGLITFAIGIRILTSSVKALGEMNLTDMLWGLAGTIALLEAINLFTKEAKNYQMDMSSAVALILTIAAIKMMTSAAVSLGEMNFTSFAQGMVGVLVLLKAIDLFTKEATKYQINVRSAVALILTIETIKMMTSAAVSLGELDYYSFAQGLVGVLVLLEAINLFTKEVTQTNINAQTISILITSAAAIMKLSEIILDLSELSFVQVIQGTVSILAFLVGYAQFIKKISDMDINVKGLMMLVSVSGAIVSVGKAIAMLGKLSPEELQNGAFAVGGIILSLLGIIVALSKAEGDITEGAKGLVIIALAIMVLVPSLQKLATIPIDQLVPMMVSLAGSLLVLFVAGYAMGKNSDYMVKGAGALILLSVALLVLAPALKILASINIEGIAPMMISLAGSLIILFTAGYIMGQNALMLAAGGAALILLAAGIAVLAPALAILGSLKLGQIIGGLIALAGALTILYVAGMAFGSSAPVIAAGALALLGIGGSIALLGAGLLAIGYALPVIGIGIRQLSDSLDEVGAKAITNIANNLSNIANMIGKFISDLVVSVLDAIGKGIPAISKFLLEGLISVINSLANGIRTYGPLIIKAVWNLAEALMELVISGIQEVVKLIPGVGDLFADGLEGAKGLLRDKFGPEEMKEIGSDALGDKGLAGGMKSQEGTLNDTSNDLGGDIIGTFGNLLTGGKGFDVGSLFGGDVSSGLLSTQGLLGDSANSIGDTVLGSLGGIDTSSFGLGYGMDLSDGMDSSQSYVDQSSQDLTGIVTGNLEGSDADFKKVADQNVSSYTNQFQANTTQNYVKKSATNLANEGVSGVASKKGEFEEVGKDSGRGFGDGLDSDDIKKYVNDKSSNLAKTALTAMRRTVKAKSPSREGMKIGGHTGLGFALGLSNMSKTVRSKASYLGESALDGMRNALATLSDLASAEMVTDPMIRPVLDLSDIQNGMGVMNSMFDSPMLGLRASLAGNGSTVTDLYNAANMINSATNNNGVIGEMIALRNDVKNLGQAMSQMKMYMDGREVGGIVSHEVDRRLGIRYLRNKREGRA